MGQWKLMTGRDCDELRMAWVMTYVLPVTQILPQHEPSCILSQHQVCYPCAVERLVDVSPFFLLPDTSLFETLLIHPVPCCRAVTILGS